MEVEEWNNNKTRLFLTLTSIQSKKKAMPAVNAEKKNGTQKNSVESKDVFIDISNLSRSCPLQQLPHKPE
jgi:hypothetical protein